MKSPSPNADTASVPPESENQTEIGTMTNQQTPTLQGKSHQLQNIVGVGVVKAITARVLEWVGAQDGAALVQRFQGWVSGVFS